MIDRIKRCSERQSKSPPTRNLEIPYLAWDPQEALKGNSLDGTRRPPQGVGAHQRSSARAFFFVSNHSCLPIPKQKCPVPSGPVFGQLADFVALTILLRQISNDFRILARRLECHAWSRQWDIQSAVALAFLVTMSMCMD
jgi:hypothetical protein